MNQVEFPEVASCAVRSSKIWFICKTHPPVSLVMSKFKRQKKKCYLCAASVSLGEGTVPLCKPPAVVFDVALALRLALKQRYKGTRKWLLLSRF